MVFIFMVSLTHQVNIESFNCTVKRSHNMDWSEEFAFLQYADKMFEIKSQSKCLNPAASAEEKKRIFGAQNWKAWLYRFGKRRGGGMGFMFVIPGTEKFIQIEKRDEASITFVINLNK